MRYYKWGYSWPELKELFKAKNKEYAQKKEMDYKFLIELTTAALGGKGKKDGEIGKDTGEGLEEMTEEQEAALRLALGEDFDKIYGSKA